MEYQKGSHTIYDVKYHIVWVTKYRYPILKGEVALRARELIRQTCMSRNVILLQGSVGKDHIHILVEVPTTLAPAKLVQYVKGKTSRLLQEEFPHLRKRYWGQHLWGRGYFCATVGNITDDMVKQYIENQMKEEGKDNFQVTDEFQS
jgi:putative transposase